jgi:Family of unknown function (DUF6510)
MEVNDDVALDGNAAAGPLGDIFAVDVTSAQVTCGHCGATNPLADEKAYVRGPGTVLRCAGCMSVLARFVHARDAVWVDLRGSAAWQLRAPH